MTALQFVEPCSSPEEAAQIFEVLQGQDGYLGGRVLPASHDGRPDRVQVFFQDEDPSVTWFPDGVRRVTIPEGQRKALGL
jgi:hypothetical protein